jgi:nitronate monooxygenase
MLVKLLFVERLFLYIQKGELGMKTIIQAPMAGGNATPALAHAVSSAGGLGYLAGGYKTVDALKEEIHSLRALGTTEFGVNLFVPHIANVETAAIRQHMTDMAHEAQQIGEQAGKFAFSTDEWEAKLQLMMTERVPIVSFTFNLPSKEVIACLKKHDIYTVQTVTLVEEAQAAVARGIDAICVQGMEAGGHRSTFDDRDPVDVPPLVELIKQVVAAVDVPVIAAGGIMNGAMIRDVLEAGATAAQLGTAFLCCPESGTKPTHIKALTSGVFTETALTRAYTGRLARGLKNDLMKRYPDAPKAYPEMHYVTQSFRKKAGELDRPDLLAMWAGVNFNNIRIMPARQLVEILKKEAGI